MLDMPMLSTLEYVELLHKVNENVTHSDILCKVSELSKHKGYGDVNWVDINNTTACMLSEAQMLMLSSSFSDSVRWKIIEVVMQLTTDENLLESVITAEINRKRHIYRDNKKLYETWRPLVNLINPCYDNEFYAATHYQFTSLVNSFNNTKYTPYELKVIMAKMGFLTIGSHRVVEGSMGKLPTSGLKESVSYIEYLDGTFDTSVSPVYREEEMTVLINLIKEFEND